MIKLNKKTFKILFIVLIVLFGLTIYILPRLINTDYYTNRTLAFYAVQGKTHLDGINSYIQYLNPIYFWYNIGCQIWGWFVALSVFILFFKVENLKQINKLFEKNNKKLYLWVNLSYILWGILSVILYINDLEKEVYDSCHDTLAIPLFQSACSYIYFSAIYYPLSNIIIFFTYNKKIKSIWIILALFFIILYLISNIYINFIEKFMIISILMNVINITWLILCINMLMIHLKQWKIQQIRF